MNNNDPFNPEQFLSRHEAEQAAGERQCYVDEIAEHNDRIETGIQKAMEYQFEAGASPLVDETYSLTSIAISLKRIADELESANNWTRANG